MVIFARCGLVAAAGLITAGLAGCSGSAHPAAATSPSPSASPSASPLATWRPAIPIRSLTAPGCTTAVAHTHTLTSVPHAMTRVPKGPFGVLPAPDRRWVFVADSQGVTVLRATPGHPPRVVRTVALPGVRAGLDEAFTPNARDLLVAGLGGTRVLDVAKLESGASGAVLGTLPDTSTGGAIKVVVSANGQYAFTALEDADTVEVSNLARVLSAGFGASGVAVGGIRTGLAPVGLQFSTAGTWLYVTSEGDGSGGNRPSPGHCKGEADATAGNLRVVDVATAEHDPARAVRSITAAGDSPVRVTVSSGGTLAWVTARGSDALLGFAAARLDAGQAALVADVPVGEAPVGIVPIDGGRFVVTADSNRFGGQGAQWLSVINVTDALAGRPALVGQIPAGTFPRELAVSRDGHTLYVSNYGSGQLETIPIAALIRAVTH